MSRCRRSPWRNPWRPPRLWAQRLAASAGAPCTPRQFWPISRPVPTLGGVSLELLVWGSGPQGPSCTQDRVGRAATGATGLPHGSGEPRGLDGLARGPTRGLHKPRVGRSPPRGGEHLWPGVVPTAPAVAGCCGRQAWQVPTRGFWMLSSSVWPPRCGLRRPRPVPLPVTCGRCSQPAAATARQQARPAPRPRRCRVVQLYDALPVRTLVALTHGLGKLVGQCLLAVAVELQGTCRRPSERSLLAFVRDCVEPGSEVPTDRWRGYAGLERTG